MATDPEYVGALLDICARERVGLLIPTIDDELATLAVAAPRFLERGVKVAVSPADTAIACNDKYETARLLEARGIATARTWLPSTLPAPVSLPLFIKPRVGRGGVGAFPVRSERELAFFLDYVSDPVLQPFLEGPEFTIDVLCDFEGTPLAIVPRERAVIRAGVVDRGRTVRDGRLMALGMECARAIRAVGAINIQCRVVDGVPTVFEINPRFSGGIPLTIAAGADFPRLLVQLARGRRVPPQIGRFQDGLWMTSYETSVFIAEQAIGFSATRAEIPEVA